MGDVVWAGRMGVRIGIHALHTDSQILYNETRHASVRFLYRRQAQLWMQWMALLEKITVFLNACEVEENNKKKVRALRRRCSYIFYLLYILVSFSGLWRGDVDS